MATSVLLLACLAAVACASPVATKFVAPKPATKFVAPVGENFDPLKVAEMFMNLGAVNSDPSTQNCDNYAALFETDAILHSPGVPDASGTSSIRTACESDHALVNPLISFQLDNINVTSWNTEKRTAFYWFINGIKTDDGSQVTIPAISCLLQDPTGVIQTAWSFYDDSPFIGARKALQDPPFNATDIVERYMNLGNRGESQERNCTAWADLYEEEGTSNEPGVPPVQDFDRLVQLCQSRVARFKSYVPSAQTSIPVMSWNTEKRVAFRWTITGVSQNNQPIIAPAITMLLMSSDGSIQQSWDWWDTDLLPSL